MKSYRYIFWAVWAFFTFNVFNLNAQNPYAPTPPAPPSGPRFQVSAKIDINGDKVPDEINLFTGSDENPEYRLVINDSFKIDTFEDEEPAKDFMIVDLDSSDNILEIAVRAIGASDMTTYHLYRLWGNEIFKLGTLPGKLTFLGEGHLISTIWSGYFYINRRYYLHERSLTFMLLPSETHPVNIEATVRQPFNIFNRPDTTSGVSNTFYAGTKIKLVACQESKGGDQRDIMKDWILIEGPYKIMGWAHLEDFHNMVDGIPWAN